MTDFDVIREALEWVGDTPHDVVDTAKLKADASAALSRVEAELAEAKRELDEIPFMGGASLINERAEAAEAERDEARRELFDYKRGPWWETVDARRVAEARITELEAALADIECCPEDTLRVQAVARAALDAPTKEDTDE